MDYARLKNEIKEIADIASKVPEQFRDRTFTVLLERLVADLGPPSVTEPSAQRLDPLAEPQPRESTPPVSHAKLRLPSSVRVWMTKTGVTPEELASVVMIEDDEVHFIREPSPGSIAKGQIEWALMLALKEALSKNKFSVDPEAVRSIIQEKGFYSSPNFTKYFRTPKNAKLFQGGLSSQGGARSLTSSGQEELGALVKSLASPQK